MKRNSFSRLVPILLVVVITIVVIAAVIAIGRALFFNGGDSSEKSEQTTSEVDTESSEQALVSSDEGRSVRLTLRGPIVADEKFRSLRITISPTTRTMTTYEGYLDKQIASKDYENNQQAYEEFVYALSRRNVTKPRASKESLDDTRGICADGKLYQFELLLDDEVSQNLWTSDCGKSKGNLAVDVNDLIDLFQKQIPDGKEMAQKVGLSVSNSFLQF